MEELCNKLEGDKNMPKLALIFDHAFCLISVTINKCELPFPLNLSKTYNSLTLVLGRARNFMARFEPSWVVFEPSWVAGQILFGFWAQVEPSWLFIRSSRATSQYFPKFLQIFFIVEKKLLCFSHFHAKEY